MEFNKTLHYRCSTRSFTDKPVSDEAIAYILQAAQLAPEAAGDYETTHLTVVKDHDLMEELREACMFKRKDGSKMDPFYGAGFIIFFSATDISEDHIEYCNAGCVIENMCLAAADLGLGSCYIWGCLRKLRNHPEVIEKLKLPEGYSVLSAFVAGYVKTEFNERPDLERINVTII